MRPELHPLPDEDVLAERGRLLIARAVADTSAPLALRERVERDRARAAASAGPRRRLRPFAWAAGALAAVALVALLLSTGGSSTHRDPSVLGVAKVTAAGPTAPAPRPLGNGRVDAAVEPVRFPDWTKLKWPASGRRSDRLDGRAVTTVYYRAADGTTMAYAIVDGKPLAVPDTARPVRRRGRTYSVLSADGDTIVVWREGGHTCVVRAPAVVPQDRLIALASWRPQRA